MRNAKKIITMILVTITFAFSFILDVNAASASVGLLDEVRTVQTKNTVTLSWDKATNAKGYRVFKMVDGKWKALKTTTARTYTVTNLKEKTSYTFAVRPYTKIDGETVWADKYVKVNTYTAGYVANLSKVSAAQGGISIELSWNKAQGAKGYRIYQMVNGKWKVLKTTTALKYNVTNLEERTDYSFAVRPYTKVDGETVWAKKYTQIDTCTTAFIGNVEKVTATQSGDSITLSWSKAQGAKGYRVYEMVNGSWKALKTTTASNYTINGLKFGTTHTYAIKPYTKADGETIWAKKYIKITVDVENPQDELTRKWFTKQYKIATEQYLFQLEKDKLALEDERSNIKEISSDLYVNYMNEVKRIKENYPPSETRNIMLYNAEQNYYSQANFWTEQRNQIDAEIEKIEDEMLNPDVDLIIIVLIDNCNISSKEAYEYYYLYIE